MRTFAHKQNKPKQQEFPNITRSNTAAPTASHQIQHTLYWQLAIGNQAVQRLLKPNAEEVKGGATSTAASRFAHDFSRIPMHPPELGGIQTKLAINKPGDEYEQEADRVSEQVMRMPEPQLQGACACGGGCSRCQNAQDAHEHLQTNRGEANDSGEMVAPPIVHEALGSSAQPLDAATRAFFELRFGQDFSQVRVHADALADQANRSIQAQAFTYGRNIAFRQGAYDPGSIKGKTLLAHELTHTIQQAQSDNSGDMRARSFDSGNTIVGSPGDPLEMESDKAAPVPKISSPPVIQRQASGGRKTEREKIEAALKSKDASDVKAIKDVNQATEKEKLELIRILTNQWWVGPYDEWKLEGLWSSFGDQLLPMIFNNKELWATSIESGAVLDNLLPDLKAEKSRLEAAVKEGSGKSFNEVGISYAKLQDLTQDFAVFEKGTGIYEGNKCETTTPGVIRSDCTEFALDVLKYTFAQQGLAADWAKVKKKFLQNQKIRGGGTISGLDIQAALQSEAGWKGIYWAPDPEYLVPKKHISGYDPETGEGIQSEEAKYSFERAKSKGTYYKDFGKKGYPGVSIAHTVTDYAPEMPTKASLEAGHPASKTRKDTTQLAKLKKLPFGVLTAHGARHVTILTYGKIIEFEYKEAATSMNVIMQTDLEHWAIGPKSGFHFFASGVIVAPAADIDAAFK